MRSISATAGLVAIVLLSGAAAAQTADVPLSTAGLKKLSVEELMNVEITSVSRTAENLAGAAAAVAVVTGEDIRRSGATTVPEALRFVPGLHVARRNASAWAIGSRGFSSVRSEKLLVLSDTRSIYTPLFSGVLWDVQDYLLEDVARIEVIRGPGAALWGSNAVNGVVNITTKPARDTQGLYLEAGGGTEEKTLAGLRYGGPIGGGHYRAFARYFDRDGSFNRDAASTDDWRSAHFGFRADWDRTENDTLTLQGDVYRGNVGQLVPSITILGRPGPEGRLRVAVSGGNVLGRWRHRLGADSDLQLRAYYDRTHRNDPSFEDTLDTVDLELQHRFAPASRHEAIWGVSYRHTDNRNEGKGIFAVAPQSSRDALVSAFIQDQISLNDSLRVTLGTKLEHNDFSGFEFQPSGRAAWEFSAGHTLWGAVSRAVRAPTRLERDIAVDASDPAGDPVLRLLGNEAFDSEKLLAFELGYRWQALAQLSIDVAAFHNRYRGLASLEAGTPFIEPEEGRTIVPIINQNSTDGRARGVEMLVTCAPRSNWRLSASYANVDLNLEPHGLDINRGAFLEGSTPRHQFGLRSALDLPGGWQLDAQFRNASAIESIPDIPTGEGISGYAELDLRVAWRGVRHLEIALTGQNLLHRRHAEFGAPQSRGEIERGVYGKVVWRY